MSQIQIRNAEKADINHIIGTADAVFGDGYTEIDQIANDEKKYAIVANVNGQFAGFCCGNILDADKLEDLVKKDLGVVPDDIRIANCEGKLGLIKTIAVNERFGSNGIGTRLLKDAEQKLIGLGATCIIVPAWKVGGKTPIKNLLERFSYKEWIENDTYWKKDCENQKFECISFCESCQCSVVFYRSYQLK